MTSKAIGVLDSGLGGLSILNPITAILKGETFIYLADHKYCPYGNKTSQAINRRMIVLMNYLLQKNCKAVVIACNTITTTSISLIRTLYPSIQLIGTEPAIKPALKNHLQENIAVMATSKTISNQTYPSGVLGLPCPGLVEAIESGNSTNINQTIKAIIKKITPNIRAVVLGCTHYILIKDMIKQQLPPHVIIIEPSKAIATQTKKIILKHNLRTKNNHQGIIAYLTTGNAKKVSRVASKLINNSIIFSPCSI